MLKVERVALRDSGAELWIQGLGCQRLFGHRRFSFQSLWLCFRVCPPHTNLPSAKAPHKEGDYILVRCGHGCRKVVEKKLLISLRVSCHCPEGCLQLDVFSKCQKCRIKTATMSPKLSTLTRETHTLNLKPCPTFQP